MEFIGIIPARYASTRFPGKPLVDIKGKTMIQRVYEQSLKAFETVLVATDDKRIEKTVNSFGGKVIMTSKEHKSGTDRCNEAIEKYSISSGNKYDVVVNIQGDEPFIKAEQLEKIKFCFNLQETQIATLVKKIEKIDDIFNPNKPKVIFNKNKEAIYFSRSPIPYIRNYKEPDWLNNHVFYKHKLSFCYKSICLYS